MENDFRFAGTLAEATGARIVITAGPSDGEWQLKMYLIPNSSNDTERHEVISGLEQIMQFASDQAMREIGRLGQIS